MLEGPAAWRDRLAAYDWQAQSIGKSDADVFRLQVSNRPALFVKSEAIGSFAELPGEIAVLRWLEQMALPAPRVVDARDEDGRYWLLMTALAGSDMASTPELSPHYLVGQCALALRQLHALDPASCPFDRRLAATVPMAEQRTAGGMVDETDFDGEHLGMKAHELLAKLTARLPAETDLVVCHGDACMPNFMVADGAFAGFLDCGRLGIADRHQDLALATRSIGTNFGAEAVETFLSAYEFTPEEEKVAFYRLLDEFF